MKIILRNTDFSDDQLSSSGNDEVCKILPDSSVVNSNLEHGTYTGIAELAKEYIRKNFTNKIAVDDIAKNVFTSQYHFSRIFKKHTRYSPYQYLMHVRLQHAIQLMHQKELSITEISFQSGFSSIDYFSSAFTKKYKLSPSRYRKTLKALPGQ